MAPSPEANCIALWDEKTADHDANDVGIEPWHLQEATDPFDTVAASLVFQNTGPPLSLIALRKKEPKKVPDVPLEEQDTAVLCRVARKLDTKVVSDPYQHSKMIIEVEYGREQRDILTADEAEAIPEIMDGHNNGSNAKKCITVKPDDIAKYFQAYGPPKKEQMAASTTPALAKPEPTGAGPAIPFRCKDTDSRPPPNPKFEAHQPVLTRRADASVCLNQAFSIDEWRKQRTDATQSMKKLKNIFPSIPTLSHKMEKSQKKLELAKTDPNSIPAHPGRDDGRAEGIPAGDQELHNWKVLATNPPVSVDLPPSPATDARASVSCDHTKKLSSALASSQTKLHSAIASSTKTSLPPIPKLSLSSSIRALAFQFQS
ncbi:hypothetical protein HDU91_005477 [Kappamyces sp. JEL0680]|nr:hypothetical protein HDU91_005477 [Kappamyces sp. JEL0680]